MEGILKEHEPLAGLFVETPSPEDIQTLPYFNVPIASFTLLKHNGRLRRYRKNIIY